MKYATSLALRGADRFENDPHSESLVGPQLQPQAATLGTACVSVTLTESDVVLANLPEADPVEIVIPQANASAAHCGFWDVEAYIIT